MKKFKFLSIIAIVVFCMGFVSCNEEDEPQGNVIELLGITLSSEVDMGLPSGTIWANKNIGAVSPEQSGFYYAWGEIYRKDVYDIFTYTIDIYNLDCYSMGSISGTQYDVARHKWGESWKMPTREDFAELMTECYWQWGKYKGVYGVKITGPNCRSIFLPASGSRNSDSLSGYGEFLDYWTASYKKYKVYGFHAFEWKSYPQKPLKGEDYLGAYIDFKNECYGCSVRPVKSK